MSHDPEYHRRYMATPEGRAKRMAANDRRRVALREWYAEMKAGLECERCGFDIPAALQFHHRDPTTKHGNVGDAVRAGWGKARILAEIDKCEVICANCHAIETAQAQAWLLPALQSAGRAATVTER